MAARERHRRSRRNRHLALLMVVLPKGPNCSFFARWRAAEINVPRQAQPTSDS